METFFKKEKRLLVCWGKTIKEHFKNKRVEKSEGHVSLWQWPSTLYRSNTKKHDGKGGTKQETKLRLSGCRGDELIAKSPAGTEIHLQPLELVSWFVEVLQKKKVDVLNISWVHFDSCLSPQITRLSEVPVPDPLRGVNLVQSSHAIKHLLISNLHESLILKIHSSFSFQHLYVFKLHS